MFADQVSMETRQLIAYERTLKAQATQTTAKDHRLDVLNTLIQACDYQTGDLVDKQG